MRADRKEPFKMNMPNPKIELTLKGSGSSKTSSANNEVFEKATEETKKSLKRKSDDNDAQRQQQKLASMKSKIDAISKSAEKIKKKSDGGPNSQMLLNCQIGLWARSATS